MTRIRRQRPPVTALRRARPQLALALVAWLDAKKGRTGSAKTARAYTDTATAFRAYLVELGMDLDGPPDAVALAAQQWAGRDDPAPATYNQRLAIISSFYTYAAQQGLLPTANPITQVARRPVQPYAEVHALPLALLKQRLGAIDRGTLVGARDYALLVVALQTGRRVSELQALQWADVHLVNNQLTLRWRHCKGGKVLHDTLPAATSAALLAYVHEVYGATLGDLPHTAPIWVSVSPNHRGGALSVQAIANICCQRLGTSKVHVLRHTFAKSMEDMGAKVSAIQERLGHASLATTGRYLKALNQADNPQAEALAALFGITE